MQKIMNSTMRTYDAPLYSWPLAALHAINTVLNVMPNKHIGMDTPHLGYTGRHFDYTELRPFWSECNVWQDPAQRSKAGAKVDTSAKLQPKSKPYRHVGNLTPGNYLCFDTVKGELRSLSQPTFVTDPDLMAKTLANTHNTLVDPASAAIFTKKLYPIRRPTALSSPDILELACSTHETETFAYVKVQCAKLRHPVWVKLIHYLQLAKSHYATLISFLKHRHKHGAPNVFYPCFAMCSARPADRQKYHPAVIVSVYHSWECQLSPPIRGSSGAPCVTPRLVGS
ncbi:hypothetical protein CYMTET_10679 [Cymbomonas tetramitiformis]|uniref:Uncharacterized protein n=1 Tax=Cymbomonas tetramitiformis TaxID=36881 RepID=A0AAE0GP48_9CHLO|nr:hypothetical protein CYMTET_10679 [Cymbomonas tetramitiformis]